ncbi:MAG: hypothetical protein R3Y43_01140 [Alphaproteobacteria bacterium]
MLKVFLILFFIINTNISYGYQRKEISPNFFVPTEVTQPNIPTAKKRPEAEPKKIESQTIAKEVKNKQQSFNEHPEYTQIYDEYRKDINEISKTKKFPDVSQIKKDFKGMDSNDYFLVK